MYISEQRPITFNCLEVRQPIGVFYVGVMNCSSLERITYADVRRLELGKDNRDVEDYTGIQRHLDSGREKVIGKYVNLVDATFPNSVILSISSEHAQYDEASKIMSIDFKDDIAKVLDGQHRIAGLRHYEQNPKTFEIVVKILFKANTNFDDFLIS